MPFTLTPDQSSACDSIGAWLRNFNASKTPYFTLGGLAGCGKSTLISHILATLDDLGYYAPALCTLSGKAASVLRQKGNSRACTIHSVFYEAFRTSSGWSFRPRTIKEIRAVCDIIVIDEASMVNRDLMEQLLSAKLPVLFVGDYGQLPPIGDDPGIMRHLDATLSTPLRQALDSPIIRFAHAIRKGDFTCPPDISKTSFNDKNWLAGPFSRDPSIQVICSLNKQRVFINSSIRAALGYTEPLVVGDRVITLQNDADTGLFNGDLSTVDAVHSIGDTTAAVVLDTPLGLMPITVGLSSLSMEKLTPTWNPRRDKTALHYAYAITAHKAQGSEFDSVLVAELPCRAWDRARWLYTAVTRAKNNLTYVSPH